MLGHHWPEGPAFTYSLTLAGAPSVPGAHSFPERYPRTFVDAAAASRDQRAHAVGRREHRGVRQPLEADRRRHAAGLPRVRPGPGRRGARAGGHPGLPARASATGCWRAPAGSSQRRSRAGTSTSAPSRRHPDRSPVRAKPLLAAETGGAMIDLTSPPTRESAGFAAGSDSRVWMDPHRRPFDAAVALPGGRAYRARAAMVVMLSSTRAGDPDRLTRAGCRPPASMPPSGCIAQVRRRVGLPRRLRSPTGAPARSAARRATATTAHTCSRPDDVGFVHLEFQVSHHVREGDFVITALFSWESHVP